MELAVGAMKGLAVASILLFVVYVVKWLRFRKAEAAKRKKKNMATSPITGQMYDRDYKPWEKQMPSPKNRPAGSPLDNERPAIQSSPPIFTDDDPWPTRYPGSIDSLPHIFDSPITSDDPSPSFGGGSFGGGGGGGSYDSDSSSSSSSSDYSSGSDSGSSYDSGSSDSGSSSSDW